MARRSGRRFGRPPCLAAPPLATQRESDGRASSLTESHPPASPAAPPVAPLPPYHTRACECFLHDRWGGAGCWEGEGGEVYEPDAFTKRLELVCSRDEEGAVPPPSPPQQRARAHQPHAGPRHNHYPFSSSIRQVRNRRGGKSGKRRFGVFRHARAPLLPGPPAPARPFPNPPLQLPLPPSYIAPARATPQHALPSFAAGDAARPTLVRRSPPPVRSAAADTTTFLPLFPPHTTQAPASQAASPTSSSSSKGSPKPPPPPPSRRTRARRRQERALSRWRRLPRLRRPAPLRPPRAPPPPPLPTTPRRPESP